MEYLKRCSKAGCGCKKFYMMFDGYNIQLRCIDDHYNTNVSIKKNYKQFAEYTNVEDRTGLGDKVVNKNVYNFNAINSNNTVNGSKALEKVNKSNKNNTKREKQEIRKTGTDGNIITLKNSNGMTIDLSKLNYM